MPTRNRSYSNSSLKEEKALIQLSASPGNVSRNSNIILSSTPGQKSNNSVKSSNSATMTQGIQLDSKARLRPINQRKSNLTQVNKAPTQAALFAQYTGLDTVAPEQDKDERYGRVVRDF